MSKGTALDALMAELLGDVGKLHDQIAKLNSAIPATANTFEQMNKQLLADRSRIIDSLKVIHSGQQNQSHKRGQVSERFVMITVLICCAVLLATLCLGLWVGMDSARRDKATQSAWANSKDITMLSECSGKGWRIESIEGETYCMPHPYLASDGSQYVAGWRIAKQSN